MTVMGGRRCRKFRRFDTARCDIEEVLRREVVNVVEESSKAAEFV